MMDLGFSQPWPVALEQLTGTSQMNAQSLLNYFEPLRVWLEEANREARDCVGWGGGANWFYVPTGSPRFDTHFLLLSF